MESQKDTDLRNQRRLHETGGNELCAGHPHMEHQESGRHWEETTWLDCGKLWGRNTQRP